MKRLLFLLLAVPAGAQTHTSAVLDLDQTFTGANTFTSSNTTTVTYGLSAGSATVVNGLTASSGTFTQTGTDYSIKTSSGINIAGGLLQVSGQGGVKVTYGVVASTFSGNGSGLTSLTGSNITGSISLTGASGNITNQSSMTAASFFGDGSHLTGIGGVLSGGVNGMSAYWTGATSLGVGPFIETASSVTLPTGNQMLFAKGSTTTIEMPFTTNTTTVNVTNSTLIKGIWEVIASSDPVGTPQFAFGNLKSTETFANGVIYRMRWHFQQTTGSGIPTMTMNGDGGSNYCYACTGILSGTGGRSASNACNPATTSWPLQCQDNFTNPTTYDGWFEFEVTVFGIQVHGQTSGVGTSANQPDHFTYAAWYLNNDSISTITIYGAGGGLLKHAHFVLERLVIP